jgi:hypothetical protein
LPWRKTCSEWAVDWNGSPAVFSGGVVHNNQGPAVRDYLNADEIAKYDQNLCVALDVAVQIWKWDLSLTWTDFRRITDVEAN